jgi:hypothetical protein
MANLDFYALGDDLRSLFRFVYAETDVVVYELASEFDRDVRQFASLAELEVVFKHTSGCHLTAVAAKSGKHSPTLTS